MHVDVQSLRTSILSTLRLDAEKYHICSGTRVSAFLLADVLLYIQYITISIDVGNVATGRTVDKYTSPYKAPALSVWALFRDDQVTATPTATTPLDSIRRLLFSSREVTIFSSLFLQRPHNKRLFSNLFFSVHHNKCSSQPLGSTSAPLTTETNPRHASFVQVLHAIDRALHEDHNDSIEKKKVSNCNTYSATQKPRIEGVKT